ncbi:MAG: YraN family protein [Mariprofundaceae bacterium]
MSTRKGQKAEQKASTYLQRHGYEIIGRNIRLGRGELDIVARKGDVLTFIEVKRRPTREAALLSVHNHKQQRIVSAAKSFLAGSDHYAHLQCRFDLIMLTPGLLGDKVEHMEDVIQI